MYTIGIVQAHHPNADGPADETYFFTPDEKRIIVDQIASGEHPDIEVYEEHGGGETHMGNTSTLSYAEARKRGTAYFALQKSKRIGRVVEAFCDAENNLHPVIQLYHENPRVREMMEGIKKGEKYGLSIGVDAERLPGGRLQNKRFSHIGVTKLPEYGGDPALTYDPKEPDLFGTWLHKAAVSYEGMDHILANHYLTLPGMYAAQKTRDRLAARLPKAQGVNVSVGASRPRIDSPSLITPVPVVSPVLPSAQPPPPPPMSETTTSSIPGFPLTTPASELPQYDPTQKQAADRMHRAELELDAMFTRERETIEKLEASDPSKFVRAKTLQLAFQNLMNDAGVFSDPAKRSKYSSALFKLDDYVIKAEKAYDTHIDESGMSETDRNVIKAMLRDTDVSKYGPVLAQVGASQQSFHNFRQAEAQLKKEQEERARLETELAAYKKREREFDENANLITKRQSFANTALAPSPYSSAAATAAAATTKPAEGAIPTSAGATRYMGSTIPRSEHKPVETAYNDLIPRRNDYQNSYASRTLFNDDLQRILENVSALSQKFQSSSLTPVDGTY